MKHLALILLAAGCICETTLAEENRQKNDTEKIQQVEPPSTQASPADPPPKDSPPLKRQPPLQQGSSQLDSGSQQSGNAGTPSGAFNQQPQRSSGRQLSKLKPLKTISGSIPGYMMRASQANSNQSASQGQRQFGNASGRGRGQNGLTSSQQSSLQQIFLNNSLLFDSNGDNLLAANELKDLFLLLISQNNVTNNYSAFNNFGYGSSTFGQPQYAQTNRNPSSYQSSNNRQSSNSSRSRSQSLAILLAGSIPAIQGTDLQDATLLFLLLTMQFDTNNDGALDQQELRRFAAALLNNDLNLTQVTQQVQRQR